MNDILEMNGKVYHPQHDIEIKIHNDNAKHVKCVSVTLRGDGLKKGDALDLLKEAKKLFGEAI